MGQLGPGPRPRHKPSGDEVIREVEVAEAVTGSKVCEGKLAGEVVVREVECLESAKWRNGEVERGEGVAT